MKALVVTYGYLGDVLFATSVADSLRKMGYDEIHFSTGMPHSQYLLRIHPNIDKVLASEDARVVYVEKDGSYDKEVYLKPLSFLKTPPEEFQETAGIPKEYRTSEYKINTFPEFDSAAEEYVENLRKKEGKKVVAVMTDWVLKTYLFTPEEYKAGIDVPNKGYGGSNRNIEYILDELGKDYTLIPVGLKASVTHKKSSEISALHVKSITFEASVLKACDSFIGTEGGLANLASGVGTKTIMTGDFTHQLYGWNGVIKKIKEGPRLGPQLYFPKAGHVMLNPYLTDDEVIKQIRNEL
jgi:hypothetical protein